MTDPAVWVVLPTYDEAENITAMLRAVTGVFDAHRIEGRILVVDDGSPDGTADLADRFARTDPRVSVLRRSVREGLGPAYRAGFRVALDGGATHVFEMDCDFSHDPEAIPALLAATDDADLAIGSRYIAGGGVTRWGLARRIISRGGCLYAQALLSVPVRDLTGGFKCFRRDVLEAVPLDEIAAAGYGFQIEMTYRAILLGFRVREVPITFRERIHGTSKMHWRIAVEAAWLVPRLRLQKQRLTQAAAA